MEITNTTLQKPALLLKVYDEASNIYFALKKKYDGYYKQFHNLPGGLTWRMEKTLSEFEAEIKRISESLQYLDEQIHNYIKTHNR